MAQAQRQLRELSEARQAGKQALKTTNNALKLINKASNWGVVDIIGGGLLTTMAKHSNINQAKTQMEGLRNHLENYHQELADIELNAEQININLSSFNTVADFIFDGLIFDWMVQSKIKTAKCKLENLADEINTQQSDLMQYIEITKDEIQNLEQQQQKMIEHLIVNTG